MLWKMQCFTLQSMGLTNHKFPVYTCSNVAEINYCISKINLLFFSFCQVMFQDENGCTANSNQRVTVLVNPLRLTYIH